MDQPQTTESLIGEITRQYALEPTAIRPLEGYEDRTFLLESPDGKWILKEHQPLPGRVERLDLEARLMEHFGKQREFAFPRQLKTRDGHTHFRHGNRIYRVLDYLEGTFMAEVQGDDKFLGSLGRLLGVMARKASTFGPVPVWPEPSPWDLQHLSLSQRHRPGIRDRQLQSRVHYMYQGYQDRVLPSACALRNGFIHNDANDWNVLTRNGEVAGLIDFGDACYSWLVADLAVGLTYALMDRADPLGTASKIISAYCGEFPLEETEADLLYDLVGARLCMSICQADHASREKPGSAYITISQAPIIRLLHTWIRIGPEAARRVFRKAAGLPGPAKLKVSRYRQRRQEALSPSLSLSYRRPIVMERAAFQYMFAGDGTTFLDAYNNIMHVGHCHPVVTERTALAMRRLNTNTRYHFDAILDYAESLLQHFPAPLSRVFFVNSGSAATDLALRLARHYTGRNKIMALEYGYHGNTRAAMDVSHYKFRPGQRVPDTLLCPFPKAFGSVWPDDGTAGKAFSDPCLHLLEGQGSSIAAFIAESLMGCGGQVPLPAGYLERLYPAVRARGGLCISDEVQVGFGRLGTHFWGFERYSVVPDMVVLGKPMGNGHPLGAVVCTPEIADAFASGPEFFSSFGGNPVSCAAGHAVLDVLKQEGLPGHAAETGKYLIDGLRELQNQHPGVADIRGQGLFIGVELRDRDGNPATTMASKVKNGLREQRVLIGTDGPADNVLKIKPPLPFNRNNCDELLEKLGKVPALRDSF